MALPTNIIAMFCEDIRVEEGGIMSLIGILPDHIQVPDWGADDAPPGMEKIRVIPKLGIYVRIAFDPETDIGAPAIMLTMPGQSAVRLGEIPAETVEKGRKEAKERGNLLAGVIFRATSINFRLPNLGVAKIEVQIGDDLHLAGAVNFSDPRPST